MALEVTQQTDDAYEDSTLELEVTFTDSDGNLSDPTIVTLDVTDPASAAVQYTKAAVDFTNPSTGVYRYRLALDQKGRWRYSWFGSTAASNSSERVNGYVQVVSQSR